MSEKNEWKPIESAPKDGTAILVMQNNWPGCPGGVAQECNGHNTYVAAWWEGEGPCGAWVCYMDQINDPNCPIKPTHWMPLPAAPGSTSSAPGDAQDERQANACPRCDGSGEITVMSDNSPDAHDVDVCCDHCQGSGAATDAAKYLAAALAGEKFRHMQLWGEYRNFHRSLCARFGYGHDAVHFRRDLVSLEEAIAAKVAAPAAGDALDKARLDWLEQHNGRFFNKDRISSIVGTGFLVAGDEQGVRHQSVRAAIDAAMAALAAQVPQQGEA